MSGLTIIDLIAGMIFIYFLLSIICSSVVEIALTYVNARSTLLAEWLTGIFDKPVKEGSNTVSLGQAIMDHCAVTVLSGKGKAPSYIDAKNFAAALIEKLTYDPNDPNSIAMDVETLINKIEQTTALSTELKRVLLNYAYEARGKYQEITAKTSSEVELFKHKIENWYDTSMDRLTGDLKRRYSRPFTMIVAIVAVLLLNADSINIAKYLYSDPDARTAIATQAYKAAADSTQIFNARIAAMKNANDTTAKQLQNTLQSGLDNINQAKAALEENLPLGWTTTYFKTLFPKGNFMSGILGLLAKITGLAATVFAVMMGAPFWFDLLNKVANLRGTGQKPASSSGADNNNSSAPVQPAPPITISVNSNKEEEAVG
jgi:hypothetical protein